MLYPPRDLHSLFLHLLPTQQAAADRWGGGRCVLHLRSWEEGGGLPPSPHRSKKKGGRDTAFSSSSVAASSSSFASSFGKENYVRDLDKEEEEGGKLLGGSLGKRGFWLGARSVVVGQDEEERSKDLLLDGIKQSGGSGWRRRRHARITQGGEEEEKVL